MKISYRMVLALLGSMLFLSACSINDRDNDYQLSRSNEDVLTTPEGTFNSSDKLVIPNESNIQQYGEKEDFKAPIVPSIFHPLVDLKLTWNQERVWIETPGDLSDTQKAITRFFNNLHETDTSMAVSTALRMETIAMPFYEQSWLASLWSSITRLYPEKVIYEIVLEKGELSNRVGLRYKIQKTGVNNKTEIGQWINPNTDDRLFSTTLTLWNTLSRQVVKTSNYFSSNDDVVTKSLWLDDAGNYMVNVGKNALLEDVFNVIKQSKLHLITEKPLKIAFVSADDLPKIGDLKKLIIPAFAGGKEAILGNVRRRHLDDLEWNELSYSIQLVRRTNGLFIKVDTSNTDYANVVSYRIMTALLNN